MQSWDQPWQVRRAAGHEYVLKEPSKPSVSVKEELCWGSYLHKSPFLRVREPRQDVLEHLAQPSRVDASHTW